MDLRRVPLKLLTSLVIVLGVVAAFGWPWIIGPKPSVKASAEVKLAFLNRGAMLVGFTLVCFTLAVVGAILIVRIAREEYNEARTQNLKELIEATQEDIRKKQDVNA